ncbi:hypothetical protein [Litchfieldella xinjiangensis]|nr:hypothetical protein [Halomonas xinjiangensis]
MALSRVSAAQGLESWPELALPSVGKPLCVIDKRLYGDEVGLN